MPEQAKSPYSSTRIVLWGILIVAAPMALLAVPHATFDRDWTNNLWMDDYTRVYFIHHWRFPATYDVAGNVGIPQPMFYGPLLYPLLALISEPFGVVIGVRLACALLWGLQSYLVYRLTRAAGASVLESLAAAANMSWAVYPLTNLYNRSALAEFFGTGFLVCAVAGGGLAILEKYACRRIGWVLMSGLCTAMAMGSHAPTAMIGGCVIILLGISAIPLAGPENGHPRLKRVGAMLLLAAGVAFILSPWIYVVWLTDGRLKVLEPANHLFSGAAQWRRYASIDSWWARLKPLPNEDRWTVEKYPEWLTPHLDAQWNFPLAMLAVWNVAIILCGKRDERRYKSARLLIASATIATIALLAVSISTGIQNAVPLTLAAVIQFPYRLVSHVNLALFAIFIASRMARDATLLPARFLRADRIAVATALLLSAAGLAIKLRHAAAVMVEPDLWATQGSDEILRKLPFSFVGEHDFTVNDPQAGAAIAIGDSLNTLSAPVGRGPAEPISDSQADIPSSQWVTTSILNFPWNRLILDGKPVPFESVSDMQFHEAVFVSAGVHTFGYQFEPNRMWVILSVLSDVVFLFGATACVASFIIPLRDRSAQ